MTIVSQLRNLVSGWRDKAKRIEDKYQSVNPAQTDVAVVAVTACADEVEEIIRLYGNTPVVESLARLMLGQVRDELLNNQAAGCECGNCQRDRSLAKRITDFLQ